MSNPNPPSAGMYAPAADARTPAVVGISASGAAPRWFVSVMLAALAAYAAVIGANTSVVAGGSDSSGYLNSARLLASGRLVTGLRLPPEFAASRDVDRTHFAPQGFNIFPGRTELAPTYPTGLPLHFAAAGRLLGWSVGPFVVQVLAAGVTVWLCYAAARELCVHYALAAAGAAIVAAFPVFIFTSIQTLSDTLATMWSLLALYCGLRNRTHAGWSAACGAALSVAVLVRPTNLLLAPGLVLLVGFSMRRLAFFVAGGLPGAAWLAFYNHRLYGSALSSGYGDIFGAFSLEVAVPTAVHFVKWLALLMPAALLPLAFGVFAHRDTRRRETFALALMGAAIVGVYLFYDVSHEAWWCLRFILPGVVPLVLLGLLGIEALVRHTAGWARMLRPAAALLLVAWAGVNSAHWTRKLHVLKVPAYERAYARASQLAASRLPAGALVLCSHFTGSIYYYTTLPVLMFEAPDRAQMDRYIDIARRAGRPIYAVIFEVEQDRLMRGCCPGNWNRIDGIDKVGIWHLQ